MNVKNFAWPPFDIVAVPIAGEEVSAPVHRLFFVGRNYYAHSVEMGKPVRKDDAHPFYFTKSVRTLVLSGGEISYPPGTADYQHEIELVAVLGADAFQRTVNTAEDAIFGYCCGLDMTRRDLQRDARERGLPWDTGKDAEECTVLSPIIRRHNGREPRKGEISLAVNGETRQRGDLSQMIWSVAELISDLSQIYHLRRGDIIFTGTPAGVGPVSVGDKLFGSIAGVGEIQCQIR